MKKTDELKIAINNKAQEIRKYQRAGQTEEALLYAEELDKMLDEYNTEKTLESAAFENFIRDARPLSEVTNTHKQFGVAGEEYHRNFFNQLRTGFKTAQNVLIEGTPSQGGYLVPEEFHNEIVTKLTEENALRQIGRVIATETTHKIAIQSTSPVANWVTEGQTISLDTPTYEQKTLSAYKLAVGVSVSNELLADTFYDLEGHLNIEFGKAIAAAEEEAFIAGVASDTSTPTGILSILSTVASGTITTTGASLSADDLISLCYTVRRPYRKNASWLMNDTTLAQIRKLKDSTGNYIWQQSYTEKEPDSLLGFPVYTSAYMPTAASGKVAVIFGDFSYFVIGQRGQVTFKPLRELHALQDLTSYLMIERVDGVLTNTEAIRGLKIK